MFAFAILIIMKELTIKRSVKVYPRRYSRNQYKQAANPAKMPRIILALLLAILVILSSATLLLYRRAQLREISIKENSGTSLYRLQASVSPSPTFSGLSPSISRSFHEDWETYKSKRFGFQFRNPSGYVLETTYEEVRPDRGEVQLFDRETYQAIQDESLDRGGPSQIIISAYKNDQHLTAAEWVRTHDPYIEEPYGERWVAGQKAITYTVQVMGGRGSTIVLTKEGYDYIVELSLIGPNDKITRDFERLVSTFRLPE